MNYRSYGAAPFDVAAIHGGPGAAGEMAPVAKELAGGRGVLEPLQTSDSLDGQVRELKEVLEERADPPVNLVGFSWGAWLSFIVAAEYPGLVNKLVLIGSGSFEERYAEGLEMARLARLDEKERAEAVSLLGLLKDSGARGREAAFQRLGELFQKTDSYGSVEPAPEQIDYRFDIYQRVWPQAEELRRSGGLLTLGKKIRCPVVAIHGGHDPHPAEGVREPLRAAVRDFKFILLAGCGHKPWIERQARNGFYEIIKGELL